MQQTVCVLLFLLTAISFTGCASKLSDEQKASLTTVGIGKYEILEHAKSEADGSNSSGIADGTTAAAGGGALTYLIGSAIEAGVNSYQQGEFEKQYAPYLDQVNNALPSTIAKHIEDRAYLILQRDAFFSSRLRAQSPNYFDGEIIRYGLVRFERTDGHTYLGAQILIDIWLMGADEERMFTQKMNLRSTDSYTMKELASDRTLINQLFDQAVDDFGKQFEELLNRKLGRPED